ncbi:hypothetical protein PILCRDRAFT_822370 [Piloderma croceum F 1598]|uniref:NACHT domain-containing protein n=1 Tax=Piloderma croceum (strain F 1598) TaxID=765440 RepID=A0A0C3BTL3_PILCF|nr:hypothetical protein PILCRDRAFT_822370 [Piloderma croceum F 1598]
MADRPSSTVAKRSKTKGGGNSLSPFLNLFKRPKSANASANQSNSSRVSVSSAIGAHDPIPGNDAGSAEPTVSSGNTTLNQDPTTPFQSARPPLSSVPDLLGSTVGQEGGHENSLTSIPTAGKASQTQVSDRKATIKEGLGVASRFAQTLLKKLPQYVDGNPVKMALSIVKTLIEIKDEVGDNKDELTRGLRETEATLQAVERTVAISVPKAAEQEIDNFKQNIREEMKNFEELTDKFLVTQILDYEEYKKKIRQIFQRINGATTSFQVVMTISIQNQAGQIHDDTKKAALERLRPSEKADYKTVVEEQSLKREACTDGTRVKILEDITKWANDRSLASPRVFWLTGQAGSGKTTILYTIAKRFEEDVNANQSTLLGANFLCSRQSQETQAQTRILPTIAYQLAHKCKSYAYALHVADKFDAVNHEVATQMKHLLVEPWQQSEATRPPELPPYLIAIDALDEIKDNKGPAFLSDLLTAINEYDLRGFKFLVTSRSDPQVAALCESFASKAVCRLQDVPIEEAKSDIETYLKTQLPELASTPEFAELGRRAGGLFIYAATAVKYLTPLDSITVGEQTEMLYDFLSKSYEPASSSDATSLVDELYRQIMCDAFSKLSGKVLARRLRILYTFLCTAERTSASIVAALVPDGDEEAAKAVLRDLHAVLYTQDDRVFWYHASFPDFIFTQARSNFRINKKDFTFSCNEPAHHSLLGESCFRIMKSEKSGLRFNMGSIMSSFLFDSTVALSEQVNQNISAVLRYSSHHWTHHLPSPHLINNDNLRCCISEFLQIRVLFWIETMNLLGLKNQCTPMLQFASQWVLKCGNSYSELARDIGEAANFATYFTGSPAAKSTPHLYISALATWLQDTSLARKWKNQFTRIPVFTYTKGSIDLPLMTVSARGPIMAVAFSGDGTRIVSSSSDESVRVWDASTGVELKELKGHTNLVNSAGFSSDGTRIVSSSADNSVRVWDASTGVELKELKGHTSSVFSVAFSSDGTRIVSGSNDKSVRVWDALTGVKLKELKGHTSTVVSVAFSSDGTRIVSGSSDNSVRVWDASTGVKLWDASTDAKPKGLGGYTSLVVSVAFSSDGVRIVSGSSDNSVRVWDASTGVELKKLKGHTSLVFSVAFSSDGTRIVSGSYDNSVRVWDVSTGVELKELKGHTGSVNSVAFSSDGARIVSGSDDKSVRVWDGSTGMKLQELKYHTGLVSSVSFSSNGMWIVSGSSDESVQVWDASTGVKLKELKGHTGFVNSVTFSSDSTQIVSGSYDKSVRVWDVSTGVELKKLKGHTNSVHSVTFSSDGTQIVSGSYDNSVRVWNVSTGVELKKLKGHTGSVFSVAFSSNSMQIVSGSYDNSVRVWDALTGVELKELKGHTSSVHSVAFSSDSTWIVSGSYDKSVRVWDASTGVELKELKGHTSSVNSVAFSSDSTRVVSGSYDKSVRVWDVSTGVELKELKGHTSSVNSVAFSSDSMRIVSGSDDKSVRVWDASTAVEPNELKGHTSSVNLVDKNWIISSQGSDHLMWVPPEVELAQPFNILTISPSGVATVDFHQSMIGVDWVHCYTP